MKICPECRDVYDNPNVEPECVNGAACALNKPVDQVPKYEPEIEAMFMRQFMAYIAIDDGDPHFIPMVA